MSLLIIVTFAGAVWGNTVLSSLHAPDLLGRERGHGRPVPSKHSANIGLPFANENDNNNGQDEVANMARGIG
jgi:hypothetical protein